MPRDAAQSPRPPNRDRSRGPSGALLGLAHQQAHRDSTSSASGPSWVRVTVASWTPTSTPGAVGQATTTALRSCAGTVTGAVVRTQPAEVVALTTRATSSRLRSSGVTSLGSKGRPRAPGDQLDPMVTPVDQGATVSTAVTPVPSGSSQSRAAGRRRSACQADARRPYSRDRRSRRRRRPVRTPTARWFWSKRAAGQAPWWCRRPSHARMWVPRLLGESAGLGDGQVVLEGDGLLVRARVVDGHGGVGAVSERSHPARRRPTPHRARRRARGGARCCRGAWRTAPVW